MASDIKLLDGDQVLVEGADLIVDRGQEQNSVALNLKNPIGFWHISGPRNEAGNPLSIFWNNNTAWSGAYLTINTAGNVGIGTSTPGYKLDVADRMRVRQGSNTAGIWFYQTKPAKDQAFVGMNTDTQVGFWGNTGAGWGLVMDTTTGKVDIAALQAKRSITVSELSTDNIDNLIFTGQAFTSVESGTITVNSRAVNQRAFFSLTITGETILLKKTVRLGLEKTSWKEQVFDLVKEIKNLRTEVDSLNAKVKSLEEAQRKVN